jgi:hypothetical protein
MRGQSTERAIGTSNPNLTLLGPERAVRTSGSEKPVQLVSEEEEEEEGLLGLLDNNRVLGVGKAACPC